MQQLVNHDANRPDIIFNRVDVLFEGLGRHIEWAPNIVLLFLRGGTM